MCRIPLYYQIASINRFSKQAIETQYRLLVVYFVTGPIESNAATVLLRRCHQSLVNKHCTLQEGVVLRNLFSDSPHNSKRLAVADTRQSRQSASTQ